MRALATCACLTALVLCVSACSSGGGNQSAPTTVSRRTTTTRAGPTGYESGGRTNPKTSQVVADLIPCPTTALAAEDRVTQKFNAGIKGLGTRLVPIKVSNVRICAYAHIGEAQGDVVLQAAGAVRFTSDTNQMRTPQNLDSCSAGLSYFITFANDTQHVSLADYCDYHLTNGAFGADATPEWVTELKYASLTTLDPMPTGPVPPAPTGGPG